MIYKQIELEVDCAPAGVEGVAKATLTAYIINPEVDMNKELRRPAVVVCPGGGYAMTSGREGDPIARRFLAAGYSAFVLWYEVNKLPFPSHLLLAAKAVATVRTHAEEWYIDPKNITIAGFSAGGHLAGSLGVLWNRDYVKNTLGYHNGEHRPDGMILSYPVITSGEHAHRGSFENLLMNRMCDELLTETSLEQQVSADTVPAFIWHTFEDTCVPVENALLMATALRANGVPMELHIFPKGWHGLSLVTPEVGGGPQECAVWTDMAVRWIANLNT